MTLQILVPQYNETETVIQGLLDSIALQQNVDFGEIGVVIVNDGGVLLDRGFLDRYPFRIDYIQAEHRGVSAARNRAMDEASAEYVMFADADDMFCDVCGLWLILREIAAGGFDTLTSLFTEEVRDPQGGAVYLDHERDGTFVHGKVFCLSWLRDQGIRWDESLIIHEDSFFVSLAGALAEDRKYIDHSFYLWRWRADSVCRVDPLYMLKTYPRLIDSRDALAGELTGRGKVQSAARKVCAFVIDVYYELNKPRWLDPANRAYRETTECRFAHFFRRWRELWDAIPEREKITAADRLRRRNVREGLGLETVTLADWLRQIEDLGREDRT